MLNKLFLASGTLSVLLLCSQLILAQPIIECEPIGNARPICGFSNPEDIVALPGEQAVLIGEYGASAETPMIEEILVTAQKRSLTIHSQPR